MTAAPRVCRHRTPRFLLALALTLVPLCARAQSLPVAFPLLEDYTDNDGQGSEAFLYEALGFLEEEPESPFAARLAADAVLVARRLGQQDVVELVLPLLLFEHADSVHARVGVEQFREPEPFRRFLLEQGLIGFDNDPAGFPESFAQLAGMGLDRFGEPLFHDMNFAVAAGVMAGLAGRHELVPRLLGPVLGDPRAPEPVKQAIRTALAEDMPAAERLQHLAGLPPLPELVQRTLLSLVPRQQWQSPELGPIVVGILARCGEFEDAVAAGAALEETVLMRHNASLWFCRALVALGRYDEARSVLSRWLAAGDAPVPWRERVQAFAECLEAVDDRQGTAVELVLGAARALREAEQVALEVRPAGPAGASASVHILFSVPDDTLEVQFVENGELVTAYRVEGDVAEMFFHEDPVVHRFSRPVPIPAPRLRLEKTATGRYVFGLDMDLAPEVGMARQRLGEFLATPVLSQSGPLREMLDHLLEHNGWYPSAYWQRDGNSGLVWAQLDPDSPEEKQFELVVDSAGTPVSLRGSRVDIRGISLSTGATMPSWPERPRRQYPGFEPTFLMRFMGRVGQTLEAVRTGR
jgi:hypothetical protein